MHEPGVGPMPIAEAIKALEQEDPDRFPIRSTYIGDAVIACREAARNSQAEITLLKAERDEYREALENIATSFPTPLALNGAACMSSADTTKMRNNHMIIAQQALAGRKGE